MRSLTYHRCFLVAVLGLSFIAWVFSLAIIVPAGELMLMKYSLPRVVILSVLLSSYLVLFLGVYAVMAIGHRRLKGWWPWSRKVWFIAVAMLLPFFIAGPAWAVEGLEAAGGVFERIMQLSFWEGVALIAAFVVLITLFIWIWCATHD